MTRNFLILFFLTSITGFTQTFDGYVIFHTGDTLKGQLKSFQDITDWKRFKKVLFYKDNTKLEFEPSQIAGYKVGSDTYITQDVGIKKPQLAFLRVIVKGHCSLYETKVDYGWAYTVQGARYREMILTYFVQREGEELHPIYFPDLKLGKDLYFLDNVALTYEIKTGKYRRDDLPNIVWRYNKEWEEKQKEQN